ncbi:MAG: porin [Flavobacterium sp.]|nr:porin [Flavobacterium sp.]
MNYVIKKSLLISMALFTSLCYSQSAVVDTLKKADNQIPLVPQKEAPKPEDKKVDFLNKKVSYAMLFVGDYANTLSSNVDINGKHTTDGSGSNNGFYLRYARLQAKFDITKMTVQILVNLADFKNNPQTRVLELANLKYKFNSYFTVQVGQFRPYFGLEDLYPADILKSHNWSYQYALFGINGWQSFQIGAAVFGSLSDKNIPLKYYYSFVNGNGKNQVGDNDNAKNHMFRLEYKLTKHLNLGVNAGFSRFDGQSASAYGADVQFEKKLSPNWYFAMDTEYKRGSNLTAYSASNFIPKDLNDYEMQGVYVMPLIRKMIDTQKRTGLEFSFRYEYLENLVKDGNPLRVYTPMASYFLGEDYAGKLSLVGLFVDFNNNVVNSSQYDYNQILLQYQIRF